MWQPSICQLPFSCYKSCDVWWSRSGLLCRPLKTWGTCLKEAQTEFPATHNHFLSLSNFDGTCCMTSFNDIYVQIEILTFKSRSWLVIFGVINSDHWKFWKVEKMENLELLRRSDRRFEINARNLSHTQKVINSLSRPFWSSSCRVSFWGFLRQRFPDPIICHALSAGEPADDNPQGFLASFGDENH